MNQALEQRGIDKMIIDEQFAETLITEETSRRLLMEHQIDPVQLKSVIMSHASWIQCMQKYLCICVWCRGNKAQA